MKTTIDLPDPLMRRVKIRAASEGRKLRDIMSELLERGLETPPTKSPTEGEVPYVIDVRTGMAIARTLKTPRARKVSLAESLAAMEQANAEESLSHAGHPR